MTNSENVLQLQNQVETLRASVAHSIKEGRAPDDALRSAQEKKLVEKEAELQQAIKEDLSNKGA